MSHKTLDEYLKQVTQITVKHRAEEPEYMVTGFYKETEFQETPLGKIPKEWKVVRLGEIIEIYDSKRIPLSETERSKRRGPYPYCGATGIIDWIDSYIFDGEFVLLVEDGGPFGKFENKAYLMNGKFWVNNHAHVIKALKDKGINKFLVYLLNFIDLTPYTVGSTRKKLNQEHMKEIMIPLPPLQEQVAVGEILSTVDSAIQRTKDVIEKLERLKKGLMQELLTRGIGHREYKDTEIGRIPKDWRVVKMREVAEIRGAKNINSFEKIAFIPMELIPDAGIFAGYEIRTREEIKSYTYCEAGDILLAKITPSLENGKQGIVPFDIPGKIALATTEVFPIHCKNIERLFLFYILKFSRFRNKIISSMIGTTGRRRASRESVENLEIPLPSLQEQQKIAEILSTIDEWIELEKKRRERLESLKRGLMEFLLTGRVRVRVERLDGLEGSSSSGRGG